MGRTSLVRELLRRLKSEGCFETIFVDLEGALTKEDAIAEIASRSCSIQKVWQRMKTQFANHLQNIGDRIDEVEVSEVKVKLRAGINPGDWRQRGDEVFAALAENDLPVVLAIDELPILVNRLLKGDDYCITPERRQAVDEFLSWLRKNGQEHQRRICLILSGSVGLEPILQQAGLSAHANIFSPFDLKPWDEETASACLAALAGTYGIDLPLTVAPAGGPPPSRASTPRPSCQTDLIETSWLPNTAAIRARTPGRSTTVKRRNHFVVTSAMSRTRP